MSDVLITRLNDVPYSATSCSWRIAGAPYVGITSLSYSEKRERKLVHGSRKDATPLGITSGKYSVDGLSITFLRSSFQRLIELLAPLGAGSYGDATFPIIATYSDVQASIRGATPIVILIEGARITSVKDSRDEGFDELTTEVEMMAMAMTRNGHRLYSVANGVGL